ncbi:condensation domain-containing protein [Nonomuraea sp. NBC_01738]|uniref:condensation domain-containing protein n=1 Tax=Nonomuraea sp. NBC_01738 TaxID=2976003 RepID=UPI002E15E747|nr:condensation domain-containing protein [Nonomuraea sp. NBC_01738]
MTRLSAQQRKLLAALRKQDGIGARSRPDRLPMSFAQLRTWYLDRMAPDARHYLIPLAYRLDGPVDPGALEEALNDLVARHESLRTTFTMDDRGPVQIVHDRMRITLGDEGPLDLTAGPLLRAALDGDGPFELRITLHHIVADAWSLDVFHRELSELYAARVQGREPELPELPTQYADYALAQQERDHTEDLAFWRQALEGAPPLTELPADRPRPPVQTYNGATLPFGAGDPVAFQAFCRSLGATPYMVLFAAFQVLLARQTGQRDLVVGTPIANRDRAELEPLIGFFTNTLAVRTDLRDGPSFAVVVERVREATLGAHAHQGLPFEKLVEELNPERHLDRSPVFQVMFSMLPEATATLELPGVTVEPVEVPEHTAKFDLTIGMREGLDGLAEYNTDLFDEATIRRLLAAYAQVLAEAMSDPHAREAEPAPRHESAQAITAIWREVLGRDTFGPHDNFFDVGGHSVLLLRVHERLAALYGERLTITDLFRYPTIHTLAEHLSPGQSRNIVVKAQKPTSGAVAIVGMACRFPDAGTPADLWRNVRDGIESVRDFTDEELLAEGEDPGRLGDPAYVRRGTVLDGIDLFDATLFEVTPREAEILDPQHRMFLQCSWEALEDAGLDPERHGGQIGVFAGSAMSGYLMDNLLTSPDLVRAVGDYQLMLANDKDFLPTRVSYKLDLRGPSISVNTACSTSLVAIHLARQSLASGECDVALAGGVRVNPWTRRGYLYQNGGIGSPDGHCRPFDAGGHGTIGSGGAGVVVLKRLEDAIADGDTIHAVIRGSAVNNDGTRKVGYTAPAVDGQAEVIAAALRSGGIDPATVGYIEAHGTGTALGDPIEVAALAQVFTGEGAVALGSIKSNLGHTDAAAGVAGLIKTVMALKHRTLPPTANFTAPNPRIDFAATPFEVTTEARAWPAGAAPRRAGVSSFGMGGTNAHIVLEEAPQPAARPGAQGPHLLTLSAASAAALDEQTDRLREHLRAHPRERLADVAATLGHGRRRLRHRRIVVAEDRAAAIAALGDPARQVTGEAAAREPAFVFPGQGAQYAGMGEGLYRVDGAYRAAIDECAAILPALPGILRSPDLDRTELTQPALFATEYALARTLMARGIQPVVMAGHSIGEYVAACLSGVFSLPDALRLVAARGRLVQALPPGSMLAVPLPEAEVAAFLSDEVSLAAVNAPELCVLSGPPAAIEAVETELVRRGVAVKTLRTSHAFHSAMLDPVLDAFAAEVSLVTLSAPGLPYLANLTGTWATATESKDPAYWVRHLREAVRFADCAAVLAEAGVCVAEVGPGRTLGTLVRRVSPGTAVAAMMRQGADEPATLLEGIGRLWVAGAPVEQGSGAARCRCRPTRSSAAASGSPRADAA